MAIPKWANDITETVCRNANKDIPPIIWRKSKIKNYSSGTTYKDRIVITAAGPRKEQKLILLHELTHWIIDWNEGHSDVFWDMAWKLYREYKILIQYAKWREFRYKRKAKTAYYRSLNKQ